MWKFYLRQLTGVYHSAPRPFRSFTRTIYPLIMMQAILKLDLLTRIIMHFWTFWFTKQLHKIFQASIVLTVYFRSCWPDSYVCFTSENLSFIPECSVYLNFLPIRGETSHTSLKKSFCGILSLIVGLCEETINKKAQDFFKVTTPFKGSVHSFYPGCHPERTLHCVWQCVSAC